MDTEIENFDFEDKNGVHWSHQEADDDQEEHWLTKYILEPPHDTLEDFHTIMWDHHREDELMELYDDHGLVAMVFKYVKK